MKKIEFLKNNKKIEIDHKSVKYIKEEQKVIRKTHDYIIELDFMNQICKLNLIKENLTVDIPVVEMSLENKQEFIYLTYILETEPEVKNTIKIQI